MGMFYIFVDAYSLFSCFPFCVCVCMLMMASMIIEV